MYILALIAGSTLAFTLAMVNGAFGVGSMMGITRVAHVLKPRAMLIAITVCFLAGAMIAGVYTSRTFADRIVRFNEIDRLDYSIIIVLSTLMTSLSWCVLMLKLKIPVSISQVTTGGLIGSTISISGFNGVQWGFVYLVVISWFLTGLLSMALSIAIYKLIESMESRLGHKSIYSEYFLACLAILSLLYLFSMRFIHTAFSTILAVGVCLSLVYFLVDINLIRRYARPNDLTLTRSRLLILITMILALYFGAHDVGSSAGLLAILIRSLFTEHIEKSVFFSILISSVGFAIGAYLWGSRIIETIAGRLTPLTIDTSIIVQLSVIYTIFILVVNGIPSSITIALIGAIAGVGFARGLQYVDSKTLMRMNLSWGIGVLFSVTMSLLISRIAQILV